MSLSFQDVAYPKPWLGLVLARPRVFQNQT